MAKENYVLLQRITVTAPTASVTFNSIPQTGYNDLKIVVSGRSTGTDGTSPWTGINLAFNGSSANQTARRLLGGGGAIISETGVNLGGLVSGNIATANTFGNSEIYIPNYNSLYAKSISTDTVTENNAASTLAGLVAGLWNPAVQASIHTIALSCATGNFDVGSTFSIYGIANSVTTPLLSPKAFGGDIIRTDGTYWYHAFTSTGSFITNANLSCDSLVIAGGGAGGYFGGGGGAGGKPTLFSAINLAAGSYIATIGAGASAVSSGTGGTGSSSSISSYLSAGGLGGAPGGAGLGGVAVSPAGSGGRGGYGSAIPPIVGSDGTNIYSSWSTATSTGISGYYSGGGGGGGWDLAGALGGAGGGGRGGLSRPGSTGDNAFPGSANTGGGGGGGAAASGNVPLSGAGGSGIVIIRYPV